MASDKTLNAKNLAALGAERLAELLLELAQGDAASKRHLRLELATRSGGYWPLGGRKRRWRRCLKPRLIPGGDPRPPDQGAEAAPRQGARPPRRGTGGGQPLC